MITTIMVEAITTIAMITATTIVMTAETTIVETIAAIIVMAVMTVEVILAERTSFSRKRDHFLSDGPFKFSIMEYLSTDQYPLPSSKPPSPELSPL